MELASLSKLVTLLKSLTFLKLVTLLVQGSMHCNRHGDLLRVKIKSTAALLKNATDQSGHCLRTDDVTSSEDKMFAL